MRLHSTYCKFYEYCIALHSTLYSLHYRVNEPPRRILLDL